MATLMIIGLIILGLVLFIGIVRIILSPYDGFVNLLLELMLIDWLVEGLCSIFQSIGELLDED